MAKNGPNLQTYATSIVNKNFWNFFIKIYFMLFFTYFKLLMFHTNIAKIMESLSKWNLLKICIQTTSIDFFIIFFSHLYSGEKWRYLIFFKTNDPNKTFYAYSRTSMARTSLGPWKFV